MSNIKDLRLAQYILCEALTKTAPGQLSIWGYDSNLSGVFAPFTARQQLWSAGFEIGRLNTLEWIPDEEFVAPPVDQLNSAKTELEQLHASVLDAVIRLKK